MTAKRQPAPCAHVEDRHPGEPLDLPCPWPGCGLPKAVGVFQRASKRRTKGSQSASYAPSMDQPFPPQAYGQETWERGTWKRADGLVIYRWRRIT